MTEERLKNLEDKVDEIHKALTGDEYGNEGYKQWRMRVNKFMESGMKIIWMIAGGAAVVSIVINVIFAIL